MKGIQIQITIGYTQRYKGRQTCLYKICAVTYGITDKKVSQQPIQARVLFYNYNENK